MDTKTPLTVPGFEPVAPPPAKNLKFDRSSSRTEIIDRFILTTTLPTDHMESWLFYQCLKTSTRCEISITRPKLDKKCYTFKPPTYSPLVTYVTRVRSRVHPF